MNNYSEKPKYQAAIFDLDGTLLDTLDDLTAATNFALAKSGLPLRSRDEVKSFVGNGIINLLRRAVIGGERNPAFSTVCADFKAYYQAHCYDETAPYSGVSALLFKLKTLGVRTAIVSNKADYAVQELAKHFFSELLDFAVGESPSVAKKPAPDTVLAALNFLGVQPENAVYIGDSDVDILTAKNAGLPCISVCWGFRDKAFLEESGATVIASNISELERLLIT